MVKAWYMDNSEIVEPRLDHHQNPQRFVDLDHLRTTTGVLYWKIDADNYESEGRLNEIRTERGYNYSDLLECSPGKVENFDEKLKIFFTEHLHSDEEIRFVVDGSGFFDVRDNSDQWIRIRVEKGDLLILPAGIYHRFTVDTNNYIKAMRLFIGEPVWQAHNRPSDDHPARKSYLQAAEKSFVNV